MQELMHLSILLLPNLTMALRLTLSLISLVKCSHHRSSPFHTMMETGSVVFQHGPCYIPTGWLTLSSSCVTGCRMALGSSMDNKG